MGLIDWLRRLFGATEPFAEGDFAGGRPRPQGRLGLMDLSQRLGMTVSDLQAVPVHYDRFTIPKRTSGTRTILAPAPPLKQLQRRLLRRLLGRLRAHPAAMGFERGRSIVTNALPHVGAAVVLRMDVQDFFPSTAEHRVRQYFTGIGWDDEAAALLLRWTTCDGGLPQGAPTSPRLSNLVNYRMDARLAGLAGRYGGVYTRYADDLTFSFRVDDRRANEAMQPIRRIAAGHGYRLHRRRKLSVRRRHQRQEVTGLVVNQRLALPRRTRRWLRAVEHRLAAGGRATLTPEQLAGWRAFAAMVDGGSPAQPSGPTTGLRPVS